MIGDERDADEAFSAAEIGEAGEEAGQQRAFTVVEGDVPANPEALAFADMDESVENLGFFPVATRHVVAGVGGGGFGEKVGGRGGGELGEEGAQRRFVAAIFPMPGGEQGTAEAPWARRPFGHAFVDMGAPGGGVPAAGRELDLDGDHSKTTVVVAGEAK